ncbi:MAG: H+transporting two-sector ATPase C subunit [Candidatus Brocadiaceae bacterium]|nr:H+transporting two-sector ATPase C subunit [Candidatus Brocadiaceae bacterium]
MDVGRMKRQYVGRVLLLTLVLGTLCASSGVALAAFSDTPGEAAATAEDQPSTGESSPVRWDLAVAIAVAIGVPCLAAGYAVARIGTAALGAASEKPELLGRSLIFVALAEGIAIYGLLVSVLLYALWLKVT